MSSSRCKKEEGVELVVKEVVGGAFYCKSPSSPSGTWKINSRECCERLRSLRLKEGDHFSCTISSGRPISNVRFLGR